MNPVLAVNFEWEALLPLLLFLLYGLSQLLGGRRKDIPEEQEPVDYDPTAAAEEEEQERAREVREEVRRRIAERQQAETSAETTPQQRPEPAPAASAPPRRQPQAPAPQSGGDGGIVERLAEQKRRLESARREKQRAEQESKEIYAKARRAARGSIRSSKKADLPQSAVALRDEVLDVVSSPLRLRQGILLAEILGEPRGNRPHQTDRY